MKPHDKKNRQNCSQKAESIDILKKFRRDDSVNLNMFLKDRVSGIELVGNDNNQSVSMAGKDPNDSMDLIGYGLPFYHIPINGGFAQCEIKNNLDLPSGCVDMLNCFQYSKDSESYRAVYSPKEDNINTTGDPFVLWIDNSSEIEGVGDIYPVVSGDVLACGNHIVIEYTGGRWRTVYHPENFSFYGIWSASRENIYAVGYKTDSQNNVTGAICHYNGSSWSEIDLSEVKDLANICLRTIWGSAFDDIYVGGDDALILHFNGASWSIAGFNPSPASDITGIWGVSQDNVYAVMGSISKIAQWNGVSWEIVYTLPQDTGFSIGGTSDDNVYATGTCGKIYHWNGNSWSLETVNTNETFYSVWGAGVSNVFTAGSGGCIARYNGNSWALMNSGADFKINAVNGTATDNIFAVGDYSVIRYDGNSWNSVATPNNQDWGEWLFGLYCRPEETKYILASGVRQNEQSELQGTVQAYSNGVWTEILSAPNYYLYNILSFSRNNIYVLALYDINGENQAPAIFHYNGETWALEDLSCLTQVGYKYQLGAIWGTDTNNIWAAGEKGCIIHYNGSSWEKVEASCSTVYSNDPEIGSGIVLNVANTTGFYDRDYVEISSSAGSEEASITDIVTNTSITVDYLTKNHTLVNPLIKKQFDSSSVIDDIYQTPQGKTYCVTDHIEMGCYDGNIWIILNLIQLPCDALYSVWGTSNNDVFMGAPAQIMHYDGNTWNSWVSVRRNGVLTMIPLSEYTQYDELINIEFDKIWGTSSNDVYFAGTGDMIVHYNGSGWSFDYGNVDNLDTKSIYDISGVSSSDIYAISWNENSSANYLLHFDGITWTSVDIPSGYYFYGLNCGVIE